MVDKKYRKIKKAFIDELQRYSEEIEVNKYESEISNSSKVKNGLSKISITDKNGNSCIIFLEVCEELGYGECRRRHEKIVNTLNQTGKEWMIVILRESHHRGVVVTRFCNEYGIGSGCEMSICSHIFQFCENYSVYPSWEEYAQNSGIFHFYPFKSFIKVLLGICRDDKNA